MVSIRIPASTTNLHPKTSMKQSSTSNVGLDSDCQILATSYSNNLNNQQGSLILKVTPSYTKNKNQLYYILMEVFPTTNSHIPTKMVMAFQMVN